MARLAKHKQVVVILVRTDRVETETLGSKGKRHTVYFDVRHVQHVGEEVPFMLRDHKLYWAYYDGMRLTQHFGVRPFPPNSIKGGSFYWLAIASFGSSGIWAFARERVQTK